MHTPVSLFPLLTLETLLGGELEAPLAWPLAAFCTWALQQQQLSEAPVRSVLSNRQGVHEFILLSCEITALNRVVTLWFRIERYPSSQGVGVLLNKIKPAAAVDTIKASTNLQALREPCESRDSFMYNVYENPNEVLRFKHIAEMCRYFTGHSSEYSLLGANCRWICYTLLECLREARPCYGGDWFPARNERPTADIKAAQLVKSQYLKDKHPTCCGSQYLVSPSYMVRTTYTFDPDSTAVASSSQNTTDQGRIYRSLRSLPESANPSHQPIPTFSNFIHNPTTTTTLNTISGAMSVTTILHHLVAHGCRDVSTELDPSRVSEYPASQGGSGDVYIATLRNGDRVGLKCMRMLALPADPTDEGRKFLKRAAHELYVWSKCKHPSILELFGVTIFRGQVAMVSPWVENGHLRWFLSQNPQANRCILCVRIADGVDYLHKNGTVHGDLKPENILVGKDHVPKLTDFGNAALSEYTLQFTHSDTLPGMTMRWTAPEIVREETKTTQAGDIYALGMIIFEAITGILPYAGVKDAAIMRRILNGDVPHRPETYIPAGVEQADRLWLLLTRCWAFDPLERPKAWEVKNMMEGMTPEGLLATDQHFDTAFQRSYTPNGLYS